MVMGRDLSMGGMRIEPHPELSVGDRLELAIYAEAEGNPAVVKAEVIRAEDGVGLGLRFLDLDPGVATRLERLVTQLPAVEPLADGECEAMGAVVGRILSSDGES